MSAFVPSRSLRRVFADCVSLGVMTVLGLVLSSLLVDGKVGGMIITLTTGAVWLAFLATAFFAHVPQMIWHRTSVQDLLPVSVVALVCAIVSALVFWVSEGRVLSGFVHLAVSSVLYFNALIIPRAILRLMYHIEPSQQSSSSAGNDTSACLVAGPLGLVDTFIRSSVAVGRDDRKVLGILSNAKAEQGGRLLGVPILGRLGDLDLVMKNLNGAKGQLQDLIIVREGDVFSDDELALIDACNRLNLPVRQVKVFMDDNAVDADSSQPRLQQPKPIKLSDILGRSVNLPDSSDLKALVTNKTVLVTGGGGSIGSEICQQIYQLAPKTLVVVDHSEFAVFKVRESLREAKALGSIDLLPRVVNIRDVAALEHVFGQTRPDIVFHAAALKHVNLVEENPLEGVKTNIFGTKNVLEVAAKHGCSNFVMISTDKAVRPTSLMGATKRVAEMVCQRFEAQRLAENPMGGMRVISVRFGNVLGSSGSVIPIFKRQIERGGPLTVRHKDVTRYFMTIPEAVGLVLAAFEWSEKHRTDPSDVVVLDMGEPVKIYDLAEQMIRLSGFVPHKQIGIEVTGMLPGEKLYEELFDDREQRLEAGTDRVFAAKASQPNSDELDSTLQVLRKNAEAGTLGETREVIAAIVPDHMFGA